MTEADMKKLTRADLVEMLIKQSTEMESLRIRLEAAEEKLEKRELIINSAGSIAEASLQLSGIFEAAEASCQQYLENIALLSKRIESREKETAEEAEMLLTQTRQRCEKTEAETEQKCARMVARAKAASEAFWEKAATGRNGNKGNRQDSAAVSSRRIKDRKL